MIISPSLLSCDFLNLKNEIDQLNSIDNLWLHLDIMDSHFVPNLTFGKVVVKNLSKITKHKLDAHFMVTNPDFFIDQFSDISIHNFTFHWEATIHHDRLISKAKKIYPSVGISLNPSTPTNVLSLDILKNIDLVLIMSVNPGFGGQSFIEYSLNKVSELNKIKMAHNLNFTIQVDGGVNNLNAKKLSINGANNLVAGSYIFDQKDYKKQIDSLRN